MAKPISLSLKISSALVYAFLYIPLLIVIVFSFNDSALNAEWVGFTTQWYSKLLHNEDVIQATLNSLIIAGLTAIGATILGTMAGMALHQFRSKTLGLLTIIPIALPELLMGVSMLLLFSAIDLPLGLLTVLLSHIAFSLSFVAIVIRARLAGMDNSLVEAARDLGATPWQAFRLVTVPHILPGMIAGALLAFTLSLDDYVITIFTNGTNFKTLPVIINTLIKTQITPEINAISTLLMIVTLAFAIIASRLAPNAVKGT